MLRGNTRTSLPELMRTHTNKLLGVQGKICQRMLEQRETTRLFLNKNK